MKPSEPSVRNSETMAASSRVGRWRDRLLEAGLFFTAASFLAAAGNYLFQILMARSLPVAEVGYLNAAMAFIGLLSVPILAGSQALVWSISRQAQRCDAEALARLRAACLLQLKRWTWRLAIVVAIIFWPLAVFFEFPRSGLMLVALICALALMWSAVGQVWCAGQSRFYLQGSLNLTTMLVRLGAGALLVWLIPNAEAGVLASLLAAAVFGSVLFWPDKSMASVQLDEAKPVLDDPNFRAYLAASLCVGGGIFIFGQIDMLLAQRMFAPDVLGVYAKAGLLGRAILWGAYPVLVVYLTHRAAQNHRTRQGDRLLLIYALLVAVGVLGVSLLAGPLSLVLAGRDSADYYVMAQTELTSTFARVMIPIAILQGIGIYFLATRKLIPAYTFGGLALVYGLVLFLWGQSPVFMLSLMFGAGLAAVLILLLQAIVLWSRAQPW